MNIQQNIKEESAAFVVDRADSSLVGDVTRQNTRKPFAGIVQGLFALILKESSNEPEFDFMTDIFTEQK